MPHALLDLARFDEAAVYGLDLQQASLRGASLRDTRLDVVNVHGADLTGATLHGARFHLVRYDDTTRWPRELDLSRPGLVDVGTLQVRERP